MPMSNSEACKRRETVNGLNLTEGHEGWFFPENYPRAAAMPDSAITDRPWRDKCATTGLTMDDFKLRLAGDGEHGPFPEWVTRAAVHICRAYGSSIVGLSDPKYIANVIHGQHVNSEGR